MPDTPDYVHPAVSTRPVLEPLVRTGAFKAEDLRLALRDALAAGLDTATRLALDYRALDGDEDSFRWTMTGHVGDDSVPVDVLVHRAVEASLRHALPEVWVIGEESLRSLFLRVDELLAIVDPVDGTRPYADLNAAYAVVVLLLARVKGTPGWALAGAGVVNATGHTVTVGPDLIVHSGRAGDPAEDDRVLAGIAPHREPFAVAMVGAKPRSRKRFREFEKQLGEADVAYNVGGAPMTFPLLVQNLDCIPSLDHQTQWDAIYALFATLTGGVVGTLDGRISPPKEVLSWFLTVNPGDPKVIDPLIVAKDADAYSHVLGALQRAGLA